MDSQSNLFPAIFTLWRVLVLELVGLAAAGGGVVYYILLLLFTVLEVSVWEIVLWGIVFSEESIYLMGLIGGPEKSNYCESEKLFFDTCRGLFWFGGCLIDESAFWIILVCLFRSNELKKS